MKKNSTLYLIALSIFLPLYSEKSAVLKKSKSFARLQIVTGYMLLSFAGGTFADGLLNSSECKFCLYTNAGISPISNMIGEKLHHKNRKRFYYHGCSRFSKLILGPGNIAFSVGLFFWGTKILEEGYHTLNEINMAEKNNA